MFLHIEQRHAWWLSRLPINVTARDDAGRKLEDILRGTKAKQLDLKMQIGGVRHPVRLVAVRADAQVAAQEHRERIEQARAHGKQASKDTLRLAPP